MKASFFLLNLVLIATTSLSAQESETTFTVPKQIPQETQQLDLACRLVSYGRQTKTALPLIQAVQIFKQLNVVEDKERTSEATSPFSEVQLLADAVKFADGNKNLLALIKETEKTSRGAGWQSGPVRYCSSIEPDGTNNLNYWFTGGQMAQIVLDGQGEGIYSYDQKGNLLRSDLRLTVFDQKGNIVATDQTRGENCSVFFIPPSSSQLTIEIKNAGTRRDDYVLFIYNNNR